uniref:Histone H3-K79 methyltransferase n=1 Tax=Phytophthora ramorum TaxID=164328 RepID=H3H2A9_PHYRM
MSMMEAEEAVASKSLTVVEDATKRHDELFAEFPEPEVKKVSRMEREKKELANRSLVYGEIPFETVDAIFQLMRTQFGVLLDNGGNFYDIGSGCGKVVLDGLHDVALKALDRWRYQMLDSLPATKANVDVGFAKGDAIKRPDIWRDGTLVFCNSTCFSDSLIQAISAEADQLRVGSYFVTVTKPLQSTRWQAVHEEKFHMSWGRATVIIQKKMF